MIFDVQGDGLHFLQISRFTGKITKDGATPREFYSTFGLGPLFHCSEYSNSIILGETYALSDYIYGLIGCNGFNGLLRK